MICCITMAKIISNFQKPILLWQAHMSKVVTARKEAKAYIQVIISILIL